MSGENNLIYWMLTAYAGINLVAFLIMLFDKNQSRKENKKRISEGMMFFLSVFFGAVGIYSGMFVFRHKTQKLIFIVGIPMIMLQNFSLLYVIYKIFQTI